MPPENDITGIGTKFLRYDGSEFQAVAKVFGISGPTKSRETADTTTYDSIGGYREFIGSLRDAGQITFSLNFAYSQYVLLNGDFEDDQPRQYQIQLPDDVQTTLTFMGLVTEIPMNIPLDDRVTVDVTIKISGKVEDTTT